MALLTLPDGRALEVEVSGPDGGPVLLFHHGTPAARPSSTRWRGWCTTGVIGW